MVISKEFSQTIKICNLFTTILVVLVHYNSKNSIIKNHSYDLNYIFQEALSNGFARVAVPFFALISGYFFIEKINSIYSYRIALKSKFHSLFIPYFLASGIIYFLTILLKWFFQKEIPQEFNVVSIFYGIILHPLAEQFWFLRDLIILMLISPVLFKVSDYFSYFVGIVLFILWLFHIQPFPILAGWHAIDIQTIFFFWLGGMLYSNKINFEAFIFTKTKLIISILFFWILLISVRIYIDPDLNVWYSHNYTVYSIILYKLAILIGLISIIQLSAILRNNLNLLYLSGFTFFVYLFHLLPLYYFTRITDKIIINSYSFYINFPVALFISFFLAFFVSKYFPKFYNLITGGRNPIKAVKITV